MTKWPSSGSNNGRGATGSSSGDGGNDSNKSHLTRNSLIRLDGLALCALLWTAFYDNPEINGDLYVEIVKSLSDLLPSRPSASRAHLALSLSPSRALKLEPRSRKLQLVFECFHSHKALRACE